MNKKAIEFNLRTVLIIIIFIIGIFVLITVITAIFAPNILDSILSFPARVLGIGD